MTSLPSTFSFTYARPSSSRVKTSGAISSHSPSPVQRSWSIQTFMVLGVLSYRDSKASSSANVRERHASTRVAINTDSAGENRVLVHPLRKGPVYRRSSQRKEVVPVNESEYERRLTAYEAEMTELREQAKALEEEIISLRRRLQDAPKRMRTLEERLLETKGQLAQAVSQNEKLTYTLREARDHIAALREEVDKLTQPPSAYGTLLGRNDDGTVDVFSGGRKMRVAVHPQLDEGELIRGGEVVLNESLNVVMARTPDTNGEVVTLKELLEDQRRAIVVGRADEERVVDVSEQLSGEKLRSGDSVLMD